MGRSTARSVYDFFGGQQGHSCRNWRDEAHGSGRHRVTYLIDGSGKIPDRRDYTRLSSIKTRQVICMATTFSSVNRVYPPGLHKMTQRSRRRRPAVLRPSCWEKEERCCVDVS